MTREERHIAVLNRMLESMDVYDSIQPTTERKKAIKAAIKALSQEPTGRDCLILSFVEALKRLQAENDDLKEKLKQKSCDDAISRSDMLDAIGHGTTYTSEELQRVIQNLSPVTQKSGKWIPVSERLPEEKQSVLVWCPQYKNIYCAHLEKEQWWIFGAFVQIVPNEVVAWMPLPKPYEPQERSDKE